MDTSETYINMCREAKEIQKLKPTVENWQLKDQGSFYLINNRIEILHEDNGTGWPCIGNYHNNNFLYIWLPRQDQLQEMIIGDWWDTYSKFSNWSLPMFNTPLIKTTSMEQLWLAFVMFKKYGKYWDNETWFDPIAKINWASLGNEIVKNS